MKTVPGSRSIPSLANHAISEDLPSPVINDVSLPLVSIVTPSLNQGMFIGETIESVLNQNYPNIEYWVIDGGSTDETLSVLKRYESDRRFHWISEKDKGQSDATNKGLARCRGEIFNWLCSDDLFAPGTFCRIACAWTAFSQPSVVYGWAQLINQKGDNLGYCPLQSSRVDLEKIMRLERLPMQPATFVPTENVRAIGGVDRSFHYAMDVDLWIRLIETIPFHHFPYNLALCLLHSTSKSGSLSVRFIDDAMTILMRATQRNVLSARRAASYGNLFAARVYLTPESWDLPRAGAKLKAAILADPMVLPTALCVVMKGTTRAIVGEARWIQLRTLNIR